MNYKKKKKKKTYSTKKVKGIKINLDFIFNNFPVHRIGLRLVLYYFRTIGVKITKTNAQYCTNFCYFHTNGVEIVQIGVEITPSKKY